MTIILDNYTLPEKGPIEIKVNLAIDIKVTAEEARRKVNRWLIEYVSIQMGADPPTLVLSSTRAVWRVPAYVTFPHTGRAGNVGEVDVQVETGEMLDLTERKAKIEQRAAEVASKLPPYKPHDHVPPEHLAKNVPPAKEIVEEEPQPLSAKK